MSLPVAMQDKTAEAPAAETESVLRLDARQRAMLQEMGVRLWLPPSAPEAEAGAASDVETGVGAKAPTTSAKEADAATAIQRTPAPQATKQAVQQQAWKSPVRPRFAAKETETWQASRKRRGQA